MFKLIEQSDWMRVNNSLYNAIFSFETYRILKIFLCNFYSLFFYSRSSILHFVGLFFIYGFFGKLSI
jgi:hypothetical protein